MLTFRCLSVNDSRVNGLRDYPAIEKGSPLKNFQKKSFKVSANLCNSVVNFCMPILKERGQYHYFPDRMLENIFPRGLVFSLS